MRKHISRKLVSTVVASLAVITMGVAMPKVDVKAAASSPLKVYYTDDLKHNTAVAVGKTTADYYTFKLPSGHGTIKSATWSSSNTSLFTVSSTGSKANAKCKIKAVKEGHATLKLTVKTSKDTYVESVGVSTYTIPKVKYCHGIVTPSTYLYRGATKENYECDACHFTIVPHQDYEVSKQCGGWYYVTHITDGDVVRSGWVEKSNVQAPIEARKITLNFNNIGMYVGQTAQLTGSVAPWYAAKGLDFKLDTDSANVIRVDSVTGIITAVGPGYAEISVYDKSCPRALAKCLVYVTPAVEKDSLGKLIINESKLPGAGDYLPYNKAFTYDTTSPSEVTEYPVSYKINNNVSYCATYDRYFESFKVFNTDGYGFALNRWVVGGAEIEARVNYGFASDMYGADRDKSTEELIKADVEALGGEATILTGADNNPNYPIGEDQYLIAFRNKPTVLYSGVGNSYIPFPVMVKKSNNSSWYFKPGWDDVGILKINDNKTPEDITWDMYTMNDSGKCVVETSNEYTYKTQYMVISKLPTSIAY
jgi:hypothetical protein